jgi:ferredoxin/coenzyme F420-reducing hydrogenase delta subunit
VKVIVLFCEDLERLGNGLDLGEVKAWLAERSPGVDIRRAPGPCERSERWLDSGLRGADRLVLGLCSAGEAGHEFDARARKLGLDPFSIGAVALGSYCALAHPKLLATEKAKLLLGAAVARVGAYPGSRSENAKPLLSLDRQVSRRSLFTLPPISYEVVPSIREDACAAGEGCRICAKVCHQNALAMSGGGRMALDKARCTGCGACVSVCPREAFDFPGASLREIEIEVEALLEADRVSLHPRGVLFICERSAATLEKLAREGHSYPAGWLPVEVPSLGMVTPAWALQCLNRGASAVGLIPCLSDECCSRQRGLLEGRAGYCRELLRLSGGSPESVQLFDSADEEDLARSLALLPAGRNVSGAPGAGLSFAPRSAARAVLELAERYEAPLDRSLTHPHSPLGVATIGEGCTGCGACASACPADALVLERDDEGISISFDARLCIGCEECVAVCPEGAVRLEKATDFRRLSQGKRELYRGSEARCVVCGGPVAPRAMLERISAILGEGPVTSTITRYCLDCRGIRF